MLGLSYSAARSLQSESKLPRGLSFCHHIVASFPSLGAALRCAAFLRSARTTPNRCSRAWRALCCSRAGFSFSFRFRGIWATLLTVKQQHHQQPPRSPRRHSRRQQKPATSALTHSQSRFHAHKTSSILNPKTPINSSPLFVQRKFVTRSLTHLHHNSTSPIAAPDCSLHVSNAVCTSSSLWMLTKSSSSKYLSLTTLPVPPRSESDSVVERCSFASMRSLSDW